MSESPNDACPTWADRLMRQIHDLEVKLGNLRDPKDAWAGADLGELEQRAFGEGEGLDDELATAENTVEALFGRIVRGLVAEGYDPATIANFINARVGRGGRLPYCDEREVREALEQRLH
jgi:hypothetical protein